MPSSRPEAGQRLPGIPLPASSLTFGAGLDFPLRGTYLFDKPDAVSRPFPVSLP